MQGKRDKDAEKKRLTAKAKRATTLVAGRELSRALDTLNDQQQLITDTRVATAVQQLYPNTAQHPPYPPPPDCHLESLERIAEATPKALKKMGRLSEPGPLGMRPEHLHALLEQPEYQDNLVTLIAYIAMGHIHADTLTFLRRGQIAPKPKGDTYRPILLSNLLRRIAMKALMAAEKENIGNFTDNRQYGVGTPDGAGKLTKLLRTLADEDPDTYIISLDVKAAFQTVSRASIAHKLDEHPIIAQAFRTWYPHNTTTTHRIQMADDTFQPIQANQGVDQGCPLASYGYSKGGEADMDALEAELQALHHKNRILVYLDDMYIK